MLDMFEEVFAEVAQELGCEGWWELFDSDDFSIVEERVSALLGMDAYEDDEFVAWTRELAMDL